MIRRLSRNLMLALSCTLMGCTTQGSATDQSQSAAARDAQSKTNPDAQTLLDFKKRVDDYMKLHDRMKKDSPPLKETKDPAKIHASQEVLAEKMRQARAGAKQGDIFAPPIAQALRKLMYPEVKGPEGAETKAAITEEKNEVKSVPLKVNARYPDSAPLTTVPPNILAALPRLPEDLEYRFVDKHMILYDSHADIIVDFIPNAIR